MSDAGADAAHGSLVFERAGVHVLDPSADGRPGDGTRRTILSDVTCTLTEDTVTVIGANGSGKSTLLRSEEHTSELQSRGHLVCRLLPEKKNHKNKKVTNVNIHI